jgi:hypothetical protein
MAYHIHNPLQASGHQIRLLRVLDFQDGLVCCSLEHFNFANDTCPPFVAVSYRWGKNRTNGHVLLNGRLFPICDNLNAFFANTYSSLIGEYMWIDQICIDQKNTLEQNNQVTKMDRVFQTAYKVIAWVGPEEGDSRVAMETIRSWPEGTPHSYRVSPYGVPPDNAPDDGVPVHGFQIYPQLESVIKFFRREYWYRAWVIQELVLARNIVIHCGHHKVHWKKIEDMLYTLRLGRKITEWSLEAPARQQVPIDFPAWNVTVLVKHILPITVQDIVLDRRDFGYNQGRIPEHRTLGHVLASYPDLRCKKVHDKIYALQNLVQPGKRVTVDYRKPEDEVLMDVLGEVARDTFRQVSSCGTHENVLPDTAALSKFALEWHEFLGAYETDWIAVRDVIMRQFERPARPRVLAEPRLVPKRDGRLVPKRSRRTSMRAN